MHLERSTRIPGMSQPQVILFPTSQIESNFEQILEELERLMGRAQSGAMMYEILKYFLKG